MRPLAFLLVALLAPQGVFSQPARPPSQSENPDEEQEQGQGQEGGTETSSASEGPTIARPPDGILPVSEIMRFDFGPRDRPQVELAGDRLFISTASGLLEDRDALSGALVWKLGLPQETFFRPTMIALSGDVELVLASPSGHVVRVRGSDGEILQELTFDSSIALSPLVVDSKAIVGAPNGELIAYALDTGTEQFRVATGEAPAAFAFDRDRGLLVVSGSERTLTAVDVDHGAVRWTLRGRLGFRAPAAFGEAGDKLYVGNDAGDFYCLRTEDGKTRFRWSTGAAIRDRPLVEKNRVYVTSYGNNLYAYDANGGGEQWRVGLPGRPATAPIRVYHRLLVFTLDGVLVEVDPERGRLGKSWTAPGGIASSPAVLVVPPPPTEEEEAAPGQKSAKPESEPSSKGQPPTEPQTKTEAEAGTETGTESTEAPKWFENQRIALPLRNGEVLLLGYQPPEPNPEKTAPAEEKGKKKEKAAETEKGANDPAEPQPPGKDTLSRKEDVRSPKTAVSGRTGLERNLHQE